MRASISSPFNICIPQLPIYMTGLLNHSSPVPKSKPQHEMQHYVKLVKYLCWLTTRFPQWITSRMCWEILVDNTQFNKQCRKNYVSSSECARVIMSSHISIAKLCSLRVEPTTYRCELNSRFFERRAAKSYVEWNSVQLNARPCWGPPKYPNSTLVICCNDKRPTVIIWWIVSYLDVRGWYKCLADPTTIMSKFTPARRWRNLQLNHSKCKEIRMCFKRSPPSYPHIISHGLEFEQVSTEKNPGVTFRQDFKSIILTISVPKLQSVCICYEN